MDTLLSYSYKVYLVVVVGLGRRYLKLDSVIIEGQFPIPGNIVHIHISLTDHCHNAIV